jgi:hypothetical protein
LFYLEWALNPPSSVQQTAAGIRKAASDAVFNIFIIGHE